MWVLLFLLLHNEKIDVHWGPFIRTNDNLLIPLIYGLGFGAVIFYATIYRLIPTYFVGKNKSTFWIKSLLLVLGVSGIGLIVDIIYVVNQNLELAKEQFEEYPFSAFIQWGGMMAALAIIPNFGLWILGIAFRLPQDWVRSEAQKNQLIQDKMQSELDFLRAQINPHFIFNGINSIYHLIGSDDKKARSTLLQFSDLLRYQLYECNENYIPLEKEINYIKNYLGIEEVRKGSDIELHYTIPTLSLNSKKYKIAPLLVNPFLENAFKHVGIDEGLDCAFIQIELKISNEGILSLIIKNSFNLGQQNSKSRTGGIGLSNVKRRLDILYPNQRSYLEIDSNKSVYTVQLKIHLDDH